MLYRNVAVDCTEIQKDRREDLNIDLDQFTSAEQKRPKEVRFWKINLYIIQNMYCTV